MAFVSSFTPALKPTSSLSFASPAVSSSTLHRQQSHRPSRVAMKVDVTEKVRRANSTFKSLEENRLAKEQSYFVPQRGWSPNAEKMNGRYAMMGFAIGLVTEIVSGKGILAQVHMLFDPLSKLLQ